MKTPADYINTMRDAMVETYLELHPTMNPKEIWDAAHLFRPLAAGALNAVIKDIMSDLVEIITSSMVQTLVDDPEHASDVSLEDVIFILNNVQHSIQERQR